MEPRRDLSLCTDDYKPDMSEGPRVYYEKAMVFTKKFYEEELNRISSVKLETVTPEFFFQEYTWVVHATGFSAKAVGKFMPKLLAAYGSWDKCGTENFDHVMERVRLVCNNPQKARAIHSTAKRMVDELKTIGWEKWRSLNLSDVEKIGELSYIGPVTRYHLGRNIGLLECVKPDLHLVRMAEHWGFEDCEDMCKSMRGDDQVPLGIVDLALWYCSSTFGTMEIRKPGTR